MRVLVGSLLVLVAIACCTAEDATSVQDLNSDDGAGLKVVLTCPKHAGPPVSLDPHVVVTRDGSDVLQEVGLHRRGSSGDAEWHGSGRLGEAPFMSVASVESETATKGGQRSIISLGTATAGEYKIFVVKPQESENFPRSCSISILASGNDESDSLSLGRVQVDDATTAAACKSNTKRGCNYWEAGRLQCNDDACELRNVNRIARWNPADRSPGAYTSRQTVQAPSGLGEDDEDKATTGDDEEKTSGAAVEQKMQSVVSSVSDGEEAAKKARDTATERLDDKKARVKNLKEKVKQLQHKLAAAQKEGAKAQTHHLSVQLDHAESDLDRAASSVDVAWEDVVSSEHEVLKYKKKEVQAESVLGVENIKNSIKHVQERLEETQKQRDDYKASEEKAAAELKELQKKQQDFQDQENKARATIQASELEVTTAKAQKQIALKQESDASVAHREAVERRERKIVERDAMQSRLKAAETETDVKSETHFQTLKQEMQTKLSEILGALEAVNNVVKSSQTALEEAKKKSAHAVKQMNSSEKNIAAAKREMDSAHQQWLKLGESIEEATTQRDSAEEQKTTLRNNILDQKTKARKLKDQKQQVIAEEQTKFMDIKVEGAKMAITQDNMALENAASNLGRLQKQAARNKAIVPGLVRAAAVADAKAKASNMAYSAAWVRVFKLKKQVTTAEAVTANARKVAVLAAEKVKRLTDRLKRLMKKEQKEVKAMSQNKGFDVVENIDVNAKRAQLDLIRFRLDKASKEVKKAEAQAKEYHKQEEELKRGISAAEEDAKRYHAAVGVAQNISTAKSNALNNVVVAESLESAKLVKLRQAIKKLHQELSKDTETQEAFKGAAQELKRQEESAKSMQHTEDLKEEAEQASDAAFKSQNKAEELDTEQKQLDQKLTRLMESRANARARADLAQRAARTDQQRVKKEEIKIREASEIIEASTSAKNAAENKRSRLLGEMESSSGASKQRVEYMALTNDEKEVAAQQQLADAKEKQDSDEKALQSEMMSANAYTQQEAILRSEEKHKQSQETSIQEQVSTIKSRLEKEQKAEEEFHQKAEKLNARVQHLTRIANDAIFNGHVKQAETTLEATTSTEKKVEGQIKSIEGRLGKEHAKMLLDKRLERKAAESLATDDARQKATVMAEADASWAAQEDKERLDLDVQELKSVRSDVLAQQKKVDGLRKAGDATKKKLDRIYSDVTAARDDDTKALEEVTVEEKAVLHGGKILAKAKTKAKTEMARETKYLKQERTKMDHTLEAKDEKATKEIAENDIRLENKQKSARHLFKDTIEEEEVARKLWVDATKKLSASKNTTHVGIKQMELAYRQASTAYVTAASMAIGVSRYTSQDKLTAEHNIKELSHEKMQRVRQEAESLATPIRRLDELSYQAQTRLDELKAQLKTVQLHNQKVNATEHRRIADITLAAEETEGLFSQKNGTRNEVEDTKKIAAKRIQRLEEEFALQYHENEALRLQSELQEVESHKLNIDSRLEARHHELSNLTHIAQATIRRNRVLESNTTKVAAAVVKQAFQSAKDAEKAKDDALVKLQKYKHKYRKHIKELETAVQSARKAHQKKQKQVQKAEALARKLHNNVKTKEVMEQENLHESEFKERKAENATLSSQLEAAEEQEKSVEKGPKEALRAEQFKLADAQQKEKRTHERVFELKQDLAKLKVERDDIPRRLREAEVEESRDKMKLEALTNSETKAAGAYVGAKKVAKGYAKKSDDLERKEISDSTKVHQRIQEEQALKVEEATDGRDIESEHKELRKMQAQMLKDKSAALLAGVKEKQATLTNRLTEVVANSHTKTDEAQGLLAKADAAREAAAAAAFKASSLSQEAAARAAKLAVAQYAAKSLAGQAKDYDILAKQAYEEKRAFEERIEHNKVELKALEEMLASVTSFKKDPKAISKVKDQLNDAKVQASMLKSVLAKKVQQAERVGSVSHKASEKVEWMKKQVVVKRLQSLASTRWVMMADKEAALQAKVARQALNAAYKAGSAAADAHRDAELLKAKSSDLSMQIKIDVLGEALKQATAARRKIQANLEKEHAELQQEASKYANALQMANKKAKEASSTFSMGEALRTAQYRAKNATITEKDGMAALKWEKATSLAQTEEGKYEVAMAKFQMKLRSAAKKVSLSAAMLGGLAQQEYKVQKSLQDSILTQKGSQMLAKQNEISVSQTFRKKWVQKYTSIQQQEAKAAAQAHKALANSLQTSAVARSEEHVSEIAVQAAKRFLVQTTEEHQRALSATEKARFKVEDARQHEEDAKKELEEVRFRVEKAKGADKGTNKARAAFVAAQTVRRSAAQWEDACAHESLEASTRMLQAKLKVDKQQEIRIMNFETAKAAESRSTKIHQCEIAAEALWEDATHKLHTFNVDVVAAEHKSHDVKAAIYVELLKHKEAMAIAREKVSRLTRDKTKAMRYAAMKMLEVDVAAAKHTAKEMKNLKSREATLRRKAKTAEERSKRLGEAGLKAKNLLKAEEKAEEKVQMKEFQDARKKVLSEKHNVTRSEIEEDAAALSQDNEKVAVAKAMQKAVKKEKAEMKQQQEDAITAATRFTLAAKAERAEFPRVTAKVRARVKAAAKARAALRDVSQRLKFAQQAAKLTAEQLDSTKRARVDGRKHWQHLQVCNQVNRIGAQQAELRHEIERVTLATQSYQTKIKHFEQIRSSQHSLAAKAKNQMHEMQQEVTIAHKKWLRASQDADKAWRHKKVKETEKVQWDAQVANVLARTEEKGLLEQRAKGAELELQKASREAKETQVNLKTSGEVLERLEAALRKLSREQFGHAARAKAALAEKTSLETKARKESQRGESLQVELDNVSQPDPRRKAECNGNTGPGPKLSAAWKQETLRNLVSFYLHKHKNEHVNEHENEHEHDNEHEHENEN